MVGWWVGIDFAHPYPAVSVPCSYFCLLRFLDVKVLKYFSRSFSHARLTTPTNLPRGDDEIPVELEWSGNDIPEPPDVAAFYAQVGWDVVNEGVRRISGGRNAPHRIVYGPARGAGGGSSGWIPSERVQEQLHVWGGQPSPGLARQYATTRMGDRGVGIPLKN